MREVVRMLDRLELFGLTVLLFSRRYRLSVAYITLTATATGSARRRCARPPRIHLKSKTDARPDSIDPSTESGAGDDNNLVLRWTMRWPQSILPDPRGGWLGQDHALTMVGGSLCFKDASRAAGRLERVRSVLHPATAIRQGAASTARAVLGVRSASTRRANAGRLGACANGDRTRARAGGRRRRAASSTSPGGAGSCRAAVDIPVGAVRGDLAARGGFNGLARRGEVRKRPSYRRWSRRHRVVHRSLARRG